MTRDWVVLISNIYIYIYLDLPNDVKFLLFQKLLLFWGTCIFFCLRAFFGFGPFWGTWTSHNGADKNLKRRNFPSKKRNFPSKKRKNKSGWQAFPNTQNPKHETALFLEKSKKYTKQQKKSVVSTSSDNFAQPEVPGIYTYTYIYLYIHIFMYNIFPPVH